MKKDSRAHQIYVACPVTGMPVYPGISGSKELLSKNSHLTATVICPYCGQEHELSDRTARVTGTR